MPSSINVIGFFDFSATPKVAGCKSLKQYIFCLLLRCVERIVISFEIVAIRCGMLEGQARYAEVLSFPRISSIALCDCCGAIIIANVASLSSEWRLVMKFVRRAWYGVFIRNVFIASSD